ncbi:MAG: hypothetical protein H0W10_08190 [Chloroflexi bacterium]|nr:hypothetical protein [Chloroflexota bacterium]
MTSHRVVVVPGLRRLGSLAINDWLAITIGGTIFTWRALTDAELEHELEHVRQWHRHGPLFPAVYLTESLRTRRAGKRWYHDNRFEHDARKAASRLERR